MAQPSVRRWNDAEFKFFGWILMFRALTLFLFVEACSQCSVGLALCHQPMKTSSFSIFILVMRDFKCYTIQTIQFIWSIHSEMMRTYDHCEVRICEKFTLSSYLQNIVRDLCALIQMQLIEAVNRYIRWFQHSAKVNGGKTDKIVTHKFKFIIFFTIINSWKKWWPD